MDIKNPCKENWDSMKIGLTSRFCENCSKPVQDFTKMSRNEILEFLILNYSDSICVRIYPNQLDFSYKELSIVIRSIRDKTHNSNLAFYFLTIGTLIISGCKNSDPNKSGTIGNTSIHQIENNSSKNVEVHLSNLEVDPLQMPQPTMGVICIVDSSAPQKVAEVMPEFKGGYDSLLNYLTVHLEYPEYEKKHKIEGKIVVGFTVDKTGKIIDAKVIKEVRGSKYFNLEALRVINGMPDWVPGSTQGKNVDVEFTLPITFEL